jgi:hypothetical protein
MLNIIVDGIYHCHFVLNDQLGQLIRLNVSQVTGCIFPPHICSPFRRLCVLELTWPTNEGKHPSHFYALFTMSVIHSVVK